MSNIVSDAMDARQRALKNLNRVCEITGATLNTGNNAYYMTCRNGRKFAVVSSYIYTVDPFGGPLSSTCYYVPGDETTVMPTSEKIATVLLGLWNNPDLFELWAKHLGAWI